jgi:hypothetical protein
MGNVIIEDEASEADAANGSERRDKAVSAALLTTGPAVRRVSMLGVAFGTDQNRFAPPVLSIIDVCLVFIDGHRNNYSPGRAPYTRPRSPLLGRKVKDELPDPIRENEPLSVEPLLGELRLDTVLHRSVPLDDTDHP